MPPASIPLENILGDLPNDQSQPGGEAQLDVEYIVGLANGADTFFYSFSDLNPYDPVNEGFLEYLYYVGNETYPPLVHSLSYGDLEANIFNASNPGSSEYGFRCEQEFMKLGLRGITLLFASGDSGIISDPSLPLTCKVSSTEWPTSSPYVTSIGATQLTDKYLPACGNPYNTVLTEASLNNDLIFQCTGTAETVCSSTIGGVITSGGGFSDIYNREIYAPWQNNVVNKYLNQTTVYPTNIYFNKTGRAYPDFATGGTSASTPVAAALITLWNDIRLSKNEPVLGFINPFLYNLYEVLPQAFNDITTGNNACSAGNSLSTVTCCKESFHATSGYDAVSGLGTPNYAIIADYLRNTPYVYPTPTPTIEPSPSSSSNSINVSQKAAIALGTIGTLFGLISVGILIYYLVIKGKSLRNNKYIG